MNARLTRTAAPLMPGITPRMTRLRFMSAPAGTEGTPAGTPPAGDPPAGTPPTPATVAPSVAQQPPAGTPPTGTPPDPNAPALGADGKPILAKNGQPVPAWAVDPAAAYNALLDTRKEAGDAREAKNNASTEALSKIAAALGLNPDGTPNQTPTVESLAATVTEATAAREAAEAQRDAALRQSAIVQMAVTEKVNPAALMDSVAFQTAIGTISPTDTTALKAAMDAAVAANAGLRVGPVPPGRSGGQQVGRTDPPAAGTPSLQNGILSRLNGQG